VSEGMRIFSYLCLQSPSPRVCASVYTRPVYCGYPNVGALCDSIMFVTSTYHRTTTKLDKPRRLEVASGDGNERRCIAFQVSTSTFHPYHPLDAVDVYDNDDSPSADLQSTLITPLSSYRT
jgi:hypothetical protein